MLSIKLLSCFVSCTIEFCLPRSSSVELFQHSMTCYENKPVTLISKWQSIQSSYFSCIRLFLSLLNDLISFDPLIKFLKNDFSTFMPEHNRSVLVHFAIERYFKRMFPSLPCFVPLSQNAFIYIFQNSFFDNLHPFFTHLHSSSRKVQPAFFLLELP